MQLLPEGIAGEISRDLILSPEHDASINFVYRRYCAEILADIEKLTQRKNFNYKILLDGKRGVGKSAILNQVVAAVRAKQDWIVIFEPFTSRFSTEIQEITRSSGSLYLQNHHAGNFLRSSLLANNNYFSQIHCVPASLSVTSFDGFNSKEFVKKSFSKLVKTSLRVEDHREIVQKGSKLKDYLYKHNQFSSNIIIPSLISHFGPDEQISLTELAEFGIENEAYATQVVFELFKQLNKQTKFPVLFAVDEYNETLPVSEYVSLKYDGTKFNGYIPGSDLSMNRLTKHVLNQGFHRGVCLFSTSWKKRQRRDFRPELTMGNPQELIKKTVKEFSTTEFQSFADSLISNSCIKSLSTENLAYVNMLSQGNGWQARKIIASLF